MSATVVAIQTGWRHCTKCGCLWFSGSPTSRCPSGGTHQSVLKFAVAAPNSGGTGQSNWRWCRKCQCMFFGGNTTQGVCVAGGTHDKSQSGDYTIPTGSWVGDPQNVGWRWCRKCQAMFLATEIANRCHAGAKHDSSQSGIYAISIFFF